MAAAPEQTVQPSPPFHAHHRLSPNLHASPLAESSLEESVVEAAAATARHWHPTNKTKGPRGSDAHDPLSRPVDTTATNATCAARAGRAPAAAGHRLLHHARPRLHATTHLHAAAHLHATHLHAAAHLHAAGLQTAHQPRWLSMHRL